MLTKVNYTIHVFSDFEQEEARLAAVFQRKAQDFDDLQNEIAGRDNGRARRFLNDDRRGGMSGRDRDAERDQMLSALQQILQDDPEYVALYNETMDMLTEAERATEIALEKALERQQAADAALADLRDSALTLEDGRRVYRDADGTFRFEDGSAAEDLGASAEQWHPGMPGYEDFVASRDAAEAEAAAVDELRHYQVEVLGAARDRLSDEDNPMSEREIRDMQARFGAEMPDLARQEMPDQTHTSNAVHRVGATPPMLEL